MNFDNFQTSAVTSPTGSVASLIVDKPIITGQGNSLTLSSYTMTVPPHESMPVSVLLNCITEESIDEHLEIMVRGGESSFVQVLGEVQKPKVYLNQQCVELGKIYAGVKEVVECDLGKHKSQALELVNYGNLPAYFSWESKNEKGRIASCFEPAEGTIPPKSKVRIAFECTMYVGG